MKSPGESRRMYVSCSFIDTMRRICDNSRYRPVLSLYATDWKLWRRRT